MMPTPVNKFNYDAWDGAKWMEVGISDEYEVAKKKYEHYEQWRKERNPKRAALEEKSQYDTKHGMHLVRLMKQGEEILRDGVVMVDRRDAGDAEELKAIRNGVMSYDELIEYADMMEKRFDDLYEKSTLKHSADVGAINELYKELVGKKLGLKF
jgi:hypothetical protein